MPPITTPDEPALPMMAVIFHIKDFIANEIPSEKQGKVIAFIKDCAQYPDADKAICYEE